MTTDLIKRLKEATEGSRELDALIGAQVGFGGWTPEEWAETIDSGERAGELYRPLACPEGCPHYTTSLDAAMTLVPEGAFVTLSISPRGTTCDAEVNLNNGRFLLNADTVETGMAITGPLALCIAALKAKDQS